LFAAFLTLVDKFKELFLILLTAFLAAFATLAIGAGTNDPKLFLGVFAEEEFILLDETNDYDRSKFYLSYS
jgi:hypothetical protein